MNVTRDPYLEAMLYTVLPGGDIVLDIRHEGKWKVRELGWLAVLIMEW